MEEKIRELYLKLYKQNSEILENEKENIEDVKEENKNVIQKRANKTRWTNFAIDAGILLMFYVCLNMGFNDKANMKNILNAIRFISLILIIVGLFIGLYRYIKRLDKTVEENYGLKDINVTKDKYNDLFCENICKQIIENVISNCRLYHSDGISKELYENMGFFNQNDKFISTDRIKLENNNNLVIAKVHTQFIEGHEEVISYRDLFYGVIGIQNLSFNMPFNIRIRNKRLESLKLKNAVPVYNDEFNKYYELETNNMDLLNKYFDEKTLEYFINLAKIGQNLEVNIFENHIYIRVQNSEFLKFDPVEKINEDYTTKDEVNIQNIMISINSIIAIINTSEFLSKKLEEKNK